MKNARGKFVVLYGINNLGKTTQAKRIVERLRAQNILAEYLKYPIYDIKPSGPMINNYLREGNKHGLSAREVQMAYALNRTQFEPILTAKLAQGINIIAEDYVGTGLTWGIGTGVDEFFLKDLNSHLLREDLAFLFDGERFLASQEKNHKHETNDELMRRVRAVHQRLGDELGWILINANFSIDEINEILYAYIINKLK
jgi:Thymidylate kinase